METPVKLHLEDNLYQLYNDFIGFEDFICKKCSQYDFIYSQKFQWPRYIYNLEANEVNCVQLVNELEKKITRKEIPPFLLVDPTRVPVDFENQVNNVGIRKIDYWPIIFLEYEKCNLQLKNISNFTIVDIHDEKHLKLWYEIVTKVLFKNKSLSFDYFLQRLTDARYIFQIGYFENQPVTSCMVFMDMEKKIAGTYMGATLMEFRNRGLGFEFHTKALMDAEKAGCLYATGQSSKMGFPVWQKIGFTNPNTIDVYWMLGEQFK
jgi:hypothetical protein